METALIGVGEFFSKLVLSGSLMAISGMAIAGLPKSAPGKLYLDKPENLPFLPLFDRAAMLAGKRITVVVRYELDPLDLSHRYNNLDFVVESES